MRFQPRMRDFRQGSDALSAKNAMRYHDTTQLKPLIQLSFMRSVEDNDS